MTTVKEAIDGANWDSWRARQDAQDAIGAAIAAQNMAQQAMQASQEHTRAVQEQTKETKRAAEIQLADVAAQKEVARAVQEQTKETKRAAEIQLADVAAQKEVARAAKEMQAQTTKIQREAIATTEALRHENNVREFRRLFERYTDSGIDNDRAVLKARLESLVDTNYIHLFDSSEGSVHPVKGSHALLDLNNSKLVMMLKQNPIPPTKDLPQRYFSPVFPVEKEIGLTTLERENKEFWESCVANDTKLRKDVHEKREAQLKVIWDAQAPAREAAAKLAEAERLKQELVDAQEQAELETSEPRATAENIKQKIEHAKKTSFYRNTKDWFLDLFGVYRGWKGFKIVLGISVLSFFITTGAVHSFDIASAAFAAFFLISIMAAEIVATKKAFNDISNWDDPYASAVELRSLIFLGFAAWATTKYGVTFIAQGGRVGILEGLATTALVVVGGLLAWSGHIMAESSTDDIPYWRHKDVVKRDKLIDNHLKFVDLIAERKANDMTEKHAAVLAEKQASLAKQPVKLGKPAVLED